MRYQVPQFVDIEDKIIGPLTLKQFLIYLVAVFILVPIYLFSDLSLFLTIAVPVGGVAALFAHFKLHGKTLFEVAMSAVSFLSSGQLFIWRRTQTPRFLPLKGAEYNDFLETSTTISLRDQARSLATTGSVVGVDADDPLVAE